MRSALEYFIAFLTSGATDVDKMLNIYRRDGKYHVGFHEFVKSIMLAARAGSPFNKYWPLPEHRLDVRWDKWIFDNIANDFAK